MASPMPVGVRPNPKLRSFHAYVPGEQPQGPGFIKLNTNEFPYPPSAEVLEALRQSADASVRLYPSPRCQEFRVYIAAFHNVPLESIFVGNGSDEVLRLAIEAFGGEGSTIATVDPSYSLYPNLIRLSGATQQVFKLDERIALPQELFEVSWEMLLLPNPNPPMGTVFSSSQVERLASHGGLLVLDEAYIDFADGVNHVDLLRNHSNILITRTFSKAFALAGLRLGYCIGSPDIVEAISRIADSYNVNRLSQAAGIAALKSVHHYRAYIEQMKEDRTWLGSELERRGFKVWKSQANFLFAAHRQSERIYQELKMRQILVRYFNEPLLSDGLRISIGTHDELLALLSAIDVILA